MWEGGYRGVGNLRRRTEQGRPDTGQAQLCVGFLAD